MKLKLIVMRHVSQLRSTIIFHKFRCGEYTTASNKKQFLIVQLGIYSVCTFVSEMN
jgi:hypothetical protein